MNRQLYILLFILLFSFWGRLEAQDQVFLIPDRTSCVSGDTIWFSSVVFNNSEDNTGKVVHVQLDNLKNNHITKVSVVCNKNSGEGYLQIPDSLSTGIYLLKAFTNLQKQEASLSVHQRLISVYNRFDTEIPQITYPEFVQQQPAQIKGLKLTSQQNSSGNKRKLKIDINLPAEIQDQAEEMIITARLADPLSESFATGWIDQKVEKNNQAFMPVDEKNGILISGKVFSNTDSSAVEGAIVLMSISDEFPYLDYCVSDAKGMFYFYVREAYGTGNLVIQELTDTPGANSIVLYENYIETPALESSDKILTNAERNFSEDIIRASYFDRFFRNYGSMLTDSFSITNEFKYPFYGEPTKTFSPELFIDLPDFQEISREILRGVLYREKRGEVSIRMLDYATHSIFLNEPLKLLDGVPVFDPEMFSELGTEEIKSVDAIFYRRFFGDLSFNGVLAVYTKNPSLSWTEKLDAVHVIPYPFLQPKLKWEYSNTNRIRTHIPNFKKVLFRKKWDNVSSSPSIDFDVSDIHGTIVVDITIVNKEQQILHHKEQFNMDN